MDIREEIDQIERQIEELRHRYERLIELEKYEESVTIRNKMKPLEKRLKELQNGDQYDGAMDDMFTDDDSKEGFDWTLGD